MTYYVEGTTYYVIATTYYIKDTTYYVAGMTFIAWVILRKFECQQRQITSDCISLEIFIFSYFGLKLWALKKRCIIKVAQCKPEAFGLNIHIWNSIKLGDRNMGTECNFPGSSEALGILIRKKIPDSGSNLWGTSIWQA